MASTEFETLLKPILVLESFYNEIQDKKSLNKLYETLKNNPNLNQLRFADDDSRNYQFKFGDLIFKSTIGQGKSVVKSFIHKPSKTNIAVKFVKVPFDIHHDPYKECQMQKLIQEIEIHEKLASSSYVVKLYGFCLHDGDLLICMEQMDFSLKEMYPLVHEKYKWFPETYLGYIIVAMLNGLKDLSEYKIIHRDIKPNNVLMNRTGEVKLCDFGESRFLKNGLATTHDVGTIAYWSPERFQLSFEEYDVRSDVWSLGITMAELIINKLPYDLPQEIHPQQVYITLYNIILNIKSEGILYQCFNRNGFSYQEVSSKFLELCLKEYKTRPQFQELIETSFYKTFSKITKEMLGKNLSAQDIQENQESDVSNKFRIVSIFVDILLKEKNSSNTQKTQFVLNIPRCSTIIDTENQILEMLQLDADFVAFEKCEEFIPQHEEWFEIHPFNYYTTYIKDGAKYKFSLIPVQLSHIMPTTLHTTSSKILQSEIPSRKSAQSRSFIMDNKNGKDENIDNFNKLIINLCHPNIQIPEINNLEPEMPETNFLQANKQTDKIESFSPNMNMLEKIINIFTYILIVISFILCILSMVILIIKLVNRKNFIVPANFTCISLILLLLAVIMKKWNRNKQYRNKPIRNMSVSASAERCFNELTFPSIRPLRQHLFSPSNKQYKIIFLYNVISLNEPSPTKWTIPLFIQSKEIISSGSHGMTLEALNYSRYTNDEKVVIKKLKINILNNLDLKRTFRELSLFKYLNHKNISKLWHAYTPDQTFDEFHEIYLIMEHMACPLKALIKRHNEHFKVANGLKRISALMYQLLCGINYLHENGIVHGMLSTRNIMLNKKLELKIVDLGIGALKPYECKLIEKHKKEFICHSPEILLGLEYGKEIDIWQAGCIFSELLKGQSLFKYSTQGSYYNELQHLFIILEKLGPDVEFFEKICENVKCFEGVKNFYLMNPQSWKQIIPNYLFSSGEYPFSIENARELISQMLVIDPLKRISAKQALQMNFVRWKPIEGDIVRLKTIPVNPNSIDNMNLDNEEWQKLLFDELKKEGSSNDH